MEQQFVTDTEQDEDSTELEKRPWFVVFNPFYEKQTNFYWLSPFPVHEFPSHSPWEDSVIVAHFGVEPVAKAAGFSSVDAYLLDLIRMAATSQQWST